MFNQLQKLSRHLLELPRAAKRVLVLAIDASLCVLTVWFAFYLRLGEWIPLSTDTTWLPLRAVLVSLICALPIFIVSGFYRAIFRYSGWSAFVTVVKAVLAYSLIYVTIFTAYGVIGVPRTVGIIQPILLLLAIGISRTLARYWLGDLYQSGLTRVNTSKVLIYGAGVAGRQLASALANNKEMRVVGFLDDDTRLQGQDLNGIPIHPPESLPSLVQTFAVQDVLLALPSVSRKRRNEILIQIKSAKVSVRTLPSVTELAQGRVTTNDLRDLDIDDLLGREPVAPDMPLLSDHVRGKVIMITGAGGSIGSELCRQLLYFAPASLLLVEQSEFALYSIHQELSLKTAGSTITLVPLLASVQDQSRMERIVGSWRPYTVYHAAAYKHVPLVEHNPVDGIKNNVFGTLTLAKVALDKGVTNFVLISTDKAVRPTNIMGATKRLAEMILQSFANEPVDGSTGKSDDRLKNRTVFCVVRFGNVLDSSGSVVPLFRKQLRAGGPITVTHPDITRYFMSIPEAAQLVLHAAAMSKGGDLFVLDMGTPVKIFDLAQRVIELSGLTIRNEETPDGDIAIEISGLRPAEKLYEELLIGDNVSNTQHPKIMMAKEDFLTWPILNEQLEILASLIQDNNIKDIKLLLQEAVSGYTPDQDIVDWVSVKQRT
jgi:FlaA1/EpsC-like NDP-sugar epimerase